MTSQLETIIVGILWGALWGALVIDALLDRNWERLAEIVSTPGAIVMHFTVAISMAVYDRKSVYNPITYVQEWKTKVWWRCLTLTLSVPIWAEAVHKFVLYYGYSG